MQKNVPKYTPSWVPTVRFWAESSKREVSYALCNDRRTLLWFANQRAVEYHPTLVRADQPDRMTHLVLDLDPPDADAFDMAVRAARLVRARSGRCRAQGGGQDQRGQGSARLRSRSLAGPLERLGGRHPGHRGAGRGARPAIATTAFMKDDRDGKVFIDSTRVGGATVVAAYSPRVRPGVPVSFPVTWDDLDDITPADFTVHTALSHLGTGNPWAAQMPDPQTSERRPHRGGPRHSDRPGPGHARGQAPGPRPARLARPATDSPAAPERLAATSSNWSIL